jgi:Family of unknown function (DUF6496)
MQRAKISKSDRDTGCYRVLAATHLQVCAIRTARIWVEGYQLMPSKATLMRARRAKSESGKAGEYVREEMEHIREGKHGARSAKQAIAIGLSQARRAGVKVPPRPGVKEVKATHRKPNPRRSRATLGALKREGSAAASHEAISRQVKRSARQRGAASLRRAAQKAVRTKGVAGRKRAAAKAALTRAREKAATR